jgi:phosphoribosylglycinamide formyltransferase 1
LTPVRLGVLVSGSGTILEAMVARGIDVAVVVADRPCLGLDVAELKGIEAVLLDRSPFGGFSKSFDREAYTQALTDLLRAHHVDVIAMAGFGTITTGTVHRAFPGRILNTHPSLLPQFKGWHAVREALDSGAQITGCTVHVATEELDEGPILAQRTVVVARGDNEASLHERIKSVERVLYPDVVIAVLAGLANGREPRDVGELT